MTTSERIEALRIEAGQAGDSEQVALCEQALAGQADAASACMAVLAYIEPSAEEIALSLRALVSDAEYVDDEVAILAQLPTTMSEVETYPTMVLDAVRLAMHDVYREQRAGR